MKTAIIPCICTPEYDPIESLTNGMPILIPTEDMSHWDIKCPKCGRGGLIEAKSPYLAVKEWNSIQERLRTPLIFE